VIRLLLLLVGAAVLGFLIWHVGPRQIYDAAATVGSLGLLIILLPSVLMYLVDAVAWRVTLPPVARHVSFGQVFAIRMAGEVVNMTTPTAYVGGEPVKAYLLRPYRVPMVPALASVIVAKITMSMAQVIFMLAGTLVGMWILWDAQPAGTLLLGALLSAGFILFGGAVVIFVRRYGLFAALSRALAWMGLRPAVLSRREADVQALDDSILGFFGGPRQAFYLSLALFGLGFLVEAVEVYAMLAVLGVPVDPLRALAICALTVLIKSGGFFIPGSLGVQDGGNLVLLTIFGYSEVTGIAFALMRRVRELVWIAVGLVCLGLIGRRSSLDTAELPQPAPSVPPEIG
jgi:uncharacterized protein (TIRG00374 family)